MRTVGQALVEGLRLRGVEVVFGIPGVHTIELYRGLAGGGLRHVTPRHEGGAGFMADGYARVSGKPGVAFVITGPGLTNTITAMAQAKADSVPMLVVSGVNRRASLGKGFGHLHELPDQAAMIATLCPTERVEDPAKLSEILDRAFARMASGRPGPVHIEIPTDVMGLACPEVPVVGQAVGRPVPDAAALAVAAGKLNAARRVVILAGGGARHCDAALTALAERLDAPVVMTVNARGMLHGHPLGVAASPSLDAVRALVAGADQVLALGTELGPTDYDMYMRGGFPDLSGMIRVDVCEAQLQRHPAAVTLACGVAEAVAALYPLLTAHGGDAGSGGAARAAEARLAARAELAGLHPSMPLQLRMVEAIRDAVPGAIIVGDSTQPVYAANLFYDHDLAGGWFNAATGYGALGYGLGAAIGAAVAAPGTPVICLVGDGGLQFDPAELRVAVDEQLPVTYVVWNNAAYREIAEAMRDAQTEIIGCSPSPLKLDHFAAACDLGFQSVAETPEALAEALGQPHTGPRLVEIRVLS